MTKRVVLTRPVYEPIRARHVPGLKKEEPSCSGPAAALTGERSEPVRVSESFARVHAHTGTPTPTHTHRLTYPEGGTAGGARAAARGGAHEAGGVDELLTHANALTRSERKELLDRLALATHLTDRAANNRDLEMWAISVSSALHDAIGSGVGVAYGSMLVKRTMAASSNWRPIEDFMASSGLADLQVVERQAVYSMLAKLLVEHAEQVAARSGAPLSPKLVGGCAVNIGGVFDSAFPGYLAAGLAPMVAAQMGALHG